MNILIFGVSGATGHGLVKQAREQGHAVTAFVRTPTKLKITHNNLQLVQGDIMNSVSVENAVKGKDVVISALGASSPFKYDQTVADGVSNIIKTMEQSNVKRFIYLSFIGVQESRKDGGFVIKYIATKLLKTEIAGHDNREKIIWQSNLTWTIVHAYTLTKGLNKSAYSSGEELSSSSYTITISSTDVANFMLKQINNSAFLNKAARIMY
ncbi:MAG: NAD(P)H-binding protein [Saprospiraceae bacterium]